ncbi:MAG: hypothetical protein JWN34_811, partial [Bryobacterales bacterium]|nr:hypothetical protein [Bryobacterales bacterium]
ESPLLVGAGGGATATAAAALDAGRLALGLSCVTGFAGSSGFAVDASRAGGSTVFSAAAVSVVPEVVGGSSISVVGLFSISLAKFPSLPGL